MSVQSQIDRISGNITDALAALTEKGVTVPDGSTSDALAGLIGQIEAGGGGVETCTFTFNNPDGMAVSGLVYTTIEEGVVRSFTLGEAEVFYYFEAGGSITVLKNSTVCLQIRTGDEYGIESVDEDTITQWEHSVDASTHAMFFFVVGGDGGVSIGYVMPDN